MNKTEVKPINVKDIMRSGLNPRQIVKSELKESELFHSIKANGVQHPIEVRELSKQAKAERDTKGQYELLSGERRLAASEELKLKTIPAIIYTGMTDAEAYEKTHFENRGREDLTPLELATDAQNLMKVYHYDIKAVASTLGITNKAVKLRLQLENLSPAWVQALQATPSDFNKASVHDLSIAHLELISRMDHPIQDEILGTPEDLIPELCNHDGIVSVGGLRTFIAVRYTMCLTALPWRLDDASLVSTAGACTKCPKRSDSESQRELWDTEDKDDKKAKSIVRCLDSACFNLKMNTWQDRIVEEAQKDHENLRVTGNQIAAARFGQLAVKPEEIVPAKKGEKGAFPVIVLEGTKQGISYAKPAGNNRITSSKESDTPKTLDERREQLRGQRIAIVLSSLKNQIHKGAMPLDKIWTVELMASLVAVFGGTGPAHATDRSIKSIAALQKGEKVPAMKDWSSKEADADLKTILWWKLGKDLKDALNSKNAADAISREEKAKWLAGLIGFDWDKAFTQACEEKKEPKSWETLTVTGQKKAGNKAA